MSDNMEVKAVLTAEDNASSVLRQIKGEVDRLTRSISGLTKVNVPGLKNITKPAAAKTVDDARQAEARTLQALKDRWNFQGRMARQQAAEARQADQAARVADVAAMGRLRSMMAFQTQMSQQRQQEAQEAERQRRMAEAATLRDFRSRATFSTRMARQQAREAEQAERSRQRADAAAERDEAAALRRKIAGHRYVAGLRQRHEREERQGQDRAHRDLVGRGWDTWSRGREAVRDIVRPAGVAAIAGTAVAGAATRRILGVEAKVDAAEINTRSYGGLSADAARALRSDWAAPLAEKLGSETAKMLAAWTDAVKLGIKPPDAKSFTELSTQTSEAWEIPFEKVTEIFGTINTLLTSKGEAFDIKRLGSVANTLQHLAAKQATTPEKLMSFTQRGAGAAQVLGMSQEAGLAFGSASTSLGNQAAQSGRMFDYVASRLIEMPRLTKQHGLEGEEARKLVQALGYGSAEAMDRKRRSDPDSFLPEFMSRFNKIRNPKAQDQAIRFFTGREWLGEFGRMVKGIDTYKEAVKLAKEAKGLDAIGAVWELHRLKLAFVFKQFRSGWLNILGEFGKVLSPMARQAGDIFLKWSEQLRSGGLAARFRASLEGFVNGLGFRDLPALLKGIFGEPGRGAAGAVESWKATARGLGAGIRDVADLVTGGIRQLAGGTGDPEAMARWTGRIAAFSAAMVVAGPAVVALGSISSAVLALGGAATATWTAMKLGALVSGPAAAGAGVGAAVALRAVVGRLLGGLGITIAAELGARRGEIVTAVLEAMRGVWDGILAGIKADFAKWSKEGLLRSFLRTLDPNLTIDPPRASDGKVPQEPGADVPGWRRILDILRGVGAAPARVERQPTSGDWGGMIRPASFRTVDDMVDGIDRLGRGLQAMGARVQLATLTAPSRAAIGSFGNAAAGVAGNFQGSGTGGPADPAKRFGPQFFTPGSDGPKIPGWYGRGDGRGSASGMPDPGAGSGDYKPILDHIARSEGTAGGKNGGYDVTLANGALLPGGREQDLTRMTLDQVDAMQSGMLRHPGNRWNSSAAGRYQVVQRTLRGLRQRLGLRGDQLFDQATQDRLGAELVRQRGADPAGLGQEWASLRGQKLATAVELTRQIPRGASTAPGPRDAAVGGATAVAGGVHPLDGAGRFTSDFGMRRHPITGALRMHNGVDLAAPAGTIVKAMKAGIASLDRSGDVTIKHDDGSSSTYRHVVADITAGARVAAGQAIARLRAHDPRSTGPHLHLEARDAEGRMLDPKALLAPKAQAAVDAFRSSGWQPGAGGNASALGVAPSAAAAGAARQAVTPQDAARAAAPGMPSPADASQAVPHAGERAGGMIRMDKASLGGAAGPQIHAPITINAANQSPQEMGSHLQRHIGEAWNFRSHDLEPELT